MLPKFCFSYQIIWRFSFVVIISEAPMRCNRSRAGNSICCNRLIVQSRTWYSYI